MIVIRLCDPLPSLVSITSRSSLLHLIGGEMRNWECGVEWRTYLSSQAQIQRMFLVVAHPEKLGVGSRGMTSLECAHELCAFCIVPRELRCRGQGGETYGRAGARLAGDAFNRAGGLARRRERDRAWTGCGREDRETERVSDGGIRERNLDRGFINTTSFADSSCAAWVIGSDWTGAR